MSHSPGHSGVGFPHLVSVFFVQYAKDGHSELSLHFCLSFCPREFAVIWRRWGCEHSSGFGFLGLILTESPACKLRLIDVHMRAKS